MSLEVKAAEKLQAIIDEHGALGVLLYLYENASTVLGVANTALVRGALLFVYRLIRDHGKVASQLHTLLGGLADGAIFARVMTTSEGCKLEASDRLKVMQILDECGWRLQRGVEASQKAALRDG
jgi:hypothetical protein